MDVACAVNSLLTETEVGGNMSVVKMEVCCKKFQANVFDQNRCQNCFKSRELHVLTREEMEQVKPIYASWLCLAPEGLDFDNLMQRSKKWQRRFFILYEHGCLEFALDELPSTIPQGSVNLHQCTDVIDAEGRTGQKNTLCIITPDQEIYIRGDSKEIINGWCEQLLVFRQINEQRRRKKRSSSPVLSQEEASAMKSVCSIAAAKTRAIEDHELCNPKEEDEPSEETENMNIELGESASAVVTFTSQPDKCAKQGIGKLKIRDIKQEAFSLDTHQAEGASVLQWPFQRQSTSLHSPEPWRAVTRDLSPSDLPLDCSASHSLHWQEDHAESGAKKHPKALSLVKHMMRDHENIGQPQAVTQQDKNCKDTCFIKCSMTSDECWTTGNEKQCKMCPQCSSRRQTGHIQNMEKPVGLLEAPQNNIHPLRRQQIMEVKASESSMTPDLLNFKKGWLFIDDHDQWRKYWFVLSAHSLHYYFDSGAEESSQLVGEIDLTSCHRVIELHDQRNFGFEIWTHGMVFKLATVTARMRHNWIQALTKNIQDQNAPDVASIPDDCPSRVGPRSGPDVTQESMSLSCPVSDECCTKQGSDHYMRCQGHPKTSSWTEMLMQEGAREQEMVEQNAEESISRRRGRRERRQRYAIVMGSSLCPLDERSVSTQENQQQERMREIEDCWLQVEKMAIREEKRVLLYPGWQREDSVELKKPLERYRKRMVEQTIQSESDNEDYSQDHGHGTDWSLGQEPTCYIGTESGPQKMGPNKQNLTLTDKYQETKGLVNLKDLRRQQINDLLDLHPLSQSNSEFKNELKRKSECNLLHEVINSDKPIKSLRSLALCQASRDRERAAMAVSEDTDSDKAMVKLLSQQADFLTRQNETLNQRNQELVNQLAEADREIDRLKEKFFYKPNGHQPELESIVECLELELSRSCGQLQEAQIQLAEMEEKLKDTHQNLQLKEAMLRGLGFLTMDSEYKIAFPEIIDRLRQCVQVLELKVSEVVSQQWLSNLTCKELQTQNNLPMKSAVQNGQKIMKDDEKNKMLESELGSNIPQCKGLAHTKDQQHQNRLETIEEELKKRSSLFSLLLEVISHLAGNEMPESVSEHETAQMNPKLLRRLQLENYIWESFVNTLKNTTSNNLENEEATCLLQSSEMKLEEVKIYLSALNIYKSTSSNSITLSSYSGPDNSGNASTNPVIIGINDGEMEEEQMDVMWKGLKEHMQKRLILIDHVKSKLELFTDNENLSEITRQCNIWKKTNTLYLIISVVMDIVAAYLVEKPSQSVIMQKSIAIQTENQEMRLEQNNMAVHEKSVFSEVTGKETITNLKSHIKELEDLLSERLASLQQQHEKDKERLKAAFEQSITLLKESHRKATEVLLLKHQQEHELLQEEKERLLTEEVAACLTVIEVMKRTYSLELEKMLQKACQEKTYGGGTNMEVILKSHSEELSAVQRELDALSEQYTQKCLENVHLAEALQTERDTLQQYQYQNLALSAHNRVLTSHLVKEIMSTVAKDGCSQLVHDRERYEQMIKLQVKESCQEQEIDTLKNELYAAKMDQIIASERFQKIHTELSLVKETAEQQISQLKENLRLVYKALEESIKKTMPTTPLAASS